MPKAASASDRKESLMTLKLLQPVIVGENGHLLTTDGELNWVVVVTREALDVLTHRYDATLDQLVRHSSTFLEIAEQHLARKDISGRNRIWVQEEDVELWLASEHLRRVSRQRAAMTGVVPKKTIEWAQPTTS
jgi:hypothetical protein